MQKITPFLWFDDKAEEAMNFYVSIFKNSKTGKVTRYGGVGPWPKGTVMSVTFQLDGQEFFALNGGPHFHLHASHIVVRDLRDAGGGRRAVGQAFRRRREAALRLAQGQVRPVMADRSVGVE